MIKRASLSVVLAAIVTIGCGMSASAALLATDNAADAVYSPNWDNGDNGGTGWGGGGSGGVRYGFAASNTGGAGSGGVCIITEYR